MRNALVVGLCSALMGGGALGLGHVAGIADPAIQPDQGSVTPVASASSFRGSVSTVAGYPDRGSLLSYGAHAPIVRNANTWHEVGISEAYALNAMATGGMVVAAPNGSPIRLKFVRHIEHPDGNWTWIGRPAGAQPGVEAILTFGKDAVFGTIPVAGKEPLQVTTAGGRTWMVETDPSRVASLAPTGDSDYLMATSKGGRPTVAAPIAAGIRASAAHSQSAVATGNATAIVDLLIGYTSTFATRLGGQSQSLTRLNYMVDVANQAYANSQVRGRVRLVHAMQVDYPDTTTNRSALLAMSGVNCTTASGPGQHHLPDVDVNCSTVAVPSTLQPLLMAREQYRADLVSLVRTYQVPENQSCGVAWLLGGGQSALDVSSAPFGMSVISDSSGGQFPDNGNTCSDQTLAHELGHNMGLAHDVVGAAGNDDTNGDANLLDPEEYGRYPYSFGYGTDASAGNFYTIMSLRQGNQQSIRVFSNPRLTSCNGFACGDAATSDNARTLGQTMAIVAGFRASATVGTFHKGDFNGDGKADLLWRNTVNGRNSIWLSGRSNTATTMTTVTGQSWSIVGIGDFNGDGKSDVLWRNSLSGRNSIWLSANSATAIVPTTVPGNSWGVAGIGDFNGDGKSDILWRNADDGRNSIWLSGNSTTQQTIAAQSDLSLAITAVDDFNGDGKADIFWNSNADGRNFIWASANAATPLPVTKVADTNFVMAGSGDFNGDGKGDAIWRNVATGQNVVWLSASSATRLNLSSVPAGTGWIIVGTGDVNGDGLSDLMWRNTINGRNAVWLAGNSAIQQGTTTVASQSWTVI